MPKGQETQLALAPCISVIIPVFNAAERVGRAVASAATLKGVREVILVEDGSSDHSLHACKELARQYGLVRLVRHPHGLNQGAGASRNLGVSVSTSRFVAFLDADDRYLPNRFDSDLPILLDDDTIDGVYSAIRNEYESDALRELWLSQQRPEFLSLSRAVPPEELIFVLFGFHPTATGGFCTDTITIRRDAFDRLGGFHPDLRLQQDTHLWHRLAASSRVVAGNIQSAVAVRTVHPNNRVTKLDEHELYFELWWQSLGQSFKEMGVPPCVMQAWRKAYARFRAKRDSRAQAIVALTNWAIREPSEFAIEYGHFDLTLREIFHSEPWIIKALSAKNRTVKAAKKCLR
jgi:glycosyltransferase involved in cell wall biosynthesis